MTLHPIPFESPYILGKFSFLFYQCTHLRHRTVNSRCWCIAFVLRHPSSLQSRITCRASTLGCHASELRMQRNIYPHSYMASWFVILHQQHLISVFRRPISATEVLAELQHKSKLISTPSFEDFSDRAF
jgi:hypothetical protein